MTVPGPYEQRALRSAVQQLKRAEGYLASIAKPRACQQNACASIRTAIASTYWALVMLEQDMRRLEEDADGSLQQTR